MAWIKLLYFLVFASYGTVSAYLTLFFRRVGLTNGQIGILLAVQPMVMLVSGPAWGLLADRFGLRSRLLTIVLVLSVMPSLAMMWATSFAQLLVLTVVAALMAGPITPLMDSVALENLGEHRHQYGIVRAYGSLGYAPVVWGTGLLIEMQDIRWIFVLNAILIVGACLVTTRIKQAPRALPSGVARGLGTLVRVPGWLEMMSVYLVAMVLQGVTYGFVNLYMDQLGASEGLMGVSQAVSSLGQIAVLAYIMPRALRRWGTGRLMIASLVFYVLKLGIWVVAPSPVAVGASQLLTGLSFGAATVAIVDYAARKAPAGLEVTSQSLASGLIAGSGRAIGSSAGGELYDGIGPGSTFALFALVGLAAAVVYAIRWSRKPADAQESQEVPGPRTTGSA